MRVILAIAAVLFGALGAFALIHAPSDIQIIIGVQGVGFALTFLAAIVILGRLHRLEDAARAPADAERAGVAAVADALARR